MFVLVLAYAKFGYRVVYSISFRVVARSSLEREACGSNLWPIKSDIGLPTARHRCDIFSKRAVLPGRSDGEIMGLHKLDTRFGIIQQV